MHAAGTKMAVVSNFDLRLRPLLEALNLDQLFDALIISAEVSLWLLPPLGVAFVKCTFQAQKVKSNMSVRIPSL